MKPFWQYFHKVISDFQHFKNAIWKFCWISTLATSVTKDWFGKTSITSSWRFNLNHLNKLLSKEQIDLLLSTVLTRTTIIGVVKVACFTPVTSPSSYTLRTLALACFNITCLWQGGWWTVTVFTAETAVKVPRVWLDKEIRMLFKVPRINALQFPRKQYIKNFISLP